MTGVIAVARRGRVDLWTDAAAYRSDDGRAAGFVRKVLPVPGTSAVFTARGPAETWVAFDAACAEARLRGFDNLLQRLNDMFARFDLRMGPDAEVNEVLVAGYSVALGRPLILLRPNHERHAGCPARAVVAVDAFSTSPALSAPDPEAVTTADVIAALEAQRRTPMQDLAGGPAFSTVGGWIDHTVVRAGAMPQAVQVHTWPEDLVGEPMRPAA